MEWQNWTQRHAKNEQCTDGLTGLDTTLRDE